MNESDELPLSEPEQQLYTKFIWRSWRMTTKCGWDIRTGATMHDLRRVPLSQCCC